MTGTANESLPLWFPFAFVGFWLFVTFVLADKSGWRLLARKYPASLRPDGETFRRQVYKFGEVLEHGVTFLTVARDGLYLAPFFLFRMGRSPLLIPWRAITGVVHGRTFWGRHWYNLNIEGVTLIQVGQKAYDAMLAYLPPPIDVAA